MVSFSGGGTAGLVVAERLSEDPRVTVAVIEAGLHYINEPRIDTPLAGIVVPYRRYIHPLNPKSPVLVEYYSSPIGDPAFDWEYVTTPQANLYNATLPQTKGKMLGGSSGINGMVWDRASQREYDAWEQVGGYRMT